MVCGLTASWFGEAKHPQSLAVAQDAETCEAWLVTQADFGCVQWDRAG